MQPIVKLVIAGTAMFATLGLIAELLGMYSLNIKAKTVGHGQHGTARWATKGESELPKKLTLNKLALIGEAEKSP